jgi:hypothetical protein
MASSMCFNTRTLAPSPLAYPLARSSNLISTNQHWQSTSCKYLRETFAVGTKKVKRVSRNQIVWGEHESYASHECCTTTTSGPSNGITSQVSIPMTVRTEFCKVGITHNATSDPEHAVSTVTEGPNFHLLDWDRWLFYSCRITNR